MIDLTVPISPRMPVFPGDPAVAVDPLDRIAKGDPADVSRYCLGSHTGTHVDPPRHFVPGAPAIDELPLAMLVGPARVVDLARVAGAIGAVDLEAVAISAGTERLLLKTRNSRLWSDPEHPFARDYVALAEDAARWLIDRGVRLVGIDYLSIERFDAPGHPVHHALLAAGVVVVEGLDLRFATPGDHHFICLPLKVTGGDGGPARAILT
jgi:arylformamidase